MDDRRKAVQDRLDSLGIEYEAVDHVAVFTIDEMASTGIEREGEICKNLFLRDAKGKRHFLVLIPGSKHADLAGVGAALGAGKLSFASEARLMKYLGLSKGAVTPFGLINDSGKEVTVVLDSALSSFERLGFHPNVNTSTLFVSYNDLIRFLDDCGNPRVVMEL